jgi:tRNA(adenine34) deaminase
MLMLMKFNGLKYLELSLYEAKLAAEAGEVPVGAVVVHNNIVIAQAGNRIIRDTDPTAHAEIIAIRQAAHKMSNERLQECDLYVSLEPCPMCAQAISFARIRRLYYAASDYKGGGVEHGACIFSASSCHHKPEIYPESGMVIEAQRLLIDFFEKRRV